ncbi:vegetative cell wall protein gp1-like [Miscanthus floridulus]|uniref:vegetative cell wall protein gp1-like n=1 Tax=Miscanthus floridulus TaxID=154761 RepID=UPI003459C45A
MPPAALTLAHTTRTHRTTPPGASPPHRARHQHRTPQPPPHRPRCARPFTTRRTARRHPRRPPAPRAPPQARIALPAHGADRPGVFCPAPSPVRPRRPRPPPGAQPRRVRPTPSTLGATAPTPARHSPAVPPPAAPPSHVRPAPGTPSRRRRVPPRLRIPRYPSAPLVRLPLFWFCKVNILIEGRGYCSQ